MIKLTNISMIWYTAVLSGVPDHQATAYQAFATRVANAENGCLGTDPGPKKVKLINP